MKKQGTTICFSEEPKVDCLEFILFSGSASDKQVKIASQLAVSGEQKRPGSFPISHLFLGSPSARS